MSGEPTRALFIDRDGIINVDHGYVSRIDQFEFVPGIFALTRFVASELGWPIVVATNQSGIGRGYFDEQTFDLLTHWMCERFRQEGAPITQVYHCPYHPQHGIGAYRADHPWRKPKPGMLLQAAADHGISLADSVLVGDAITDIEAGAAAGIRILIRVTDREPEGPKGPKHVPAHTSVANLQAALRLIQDFAAGLPP